MHDISCVALLKPLATVDQQFTYFIPDRTLTDVTLLINKDKLFHESEKEYKT